MSPLFTVLRWLIHLVQPILVPLCFVLTWVVLIVTIWGIWSALRDGVQRAKQMHEIPCAQCRFFTHDYRLKCPVRPTIALSESAIGCTDFERLPEIQAYSVDLSRN